MAVAGRTTSPTLRVLSWNVLYKGLEARHEAICSAVAAVAPDVLLLQETNAAHAAELASRLELSLIGCGPESATGETTSVPALLIRPDALEVVDDEAAVFIDEHKPYAVARQARITGTETPVHLVSVHLMHTNQAGRMALDQAYAEAAVGRGDVADIADESLRESVVIRMGQIDRLLAATAGPPDIPVLLGGDFNFVPRGPEWSHLVAAGLMDAWEQGPRLGSRDTVIERNPLIEDGAGVYDTLAELHMPGLSGPLDYTLDFHFVRGLTCHGAWVVGRPSSETGSSWASDHLAVAGEYRLDRASLL